MSNDKVIQVKGLTKKFGDFTAVNDITFDVKKGEIFGFLGRKWGWKDNCYKNVDRYLYSHFRRSQSCRF